MILHSPACPLRRRSRLLVLIASLHAIVTGPASATEWVRTNPGGGGAFATAGAGPTGIMLAASDLSGAYRSLDRGETWDAIGSADGLTRTHVGAVGFDRVDPTILYLGTDGGIFRSADSGDTWTAVLGSGYISDVEFAAGTPATGYAAFHPVWNSNDGSVYKTTDRGLTWQQISGASLPSGLRILELYVHPALSGTVYLLAGEGRFACGPPSAWRSTDGGVSWTQIGDPNRQVMDLALDRDNPGTLYLTTYKDVYEPSYSCVFDDPIEGGLLYKSIDGGDTWTEVGSRTGILWIADGGATLRLIDVLQQFTWDSNNGVWESTDGGANWTQVGDLGTWDRGWTQAYWSYGSSFNGDSKTLGEDLSDPNALLWANGQWVYATFDGGRSFSDLVTRELDPGKWQSRGVDNVVMFDLAISPANPKVLYAGYYDLGTFCSDDHGATWRNCNDVTASGGWGGNGGNTLTVAADPVRPDVVWASQAGSVNGVHTLLRSADAGSTWTSADTGLTGGALGGLTVDPHSPVSNRTLFVTSGGDVYRSTDDGLSWLQAFDCNGCNVTAIDAFDGNLVYAGGDAGFWRSTSGGDPGSWVEVGLLEMRGAEGSDFWTRYWEGVSGITVDPARPGWVLVAVYGDTSGLYRSQSSGTSWTKLLTDDYMRRVAVSTADSTLLYATSSSAMSDGGYKTGSHGVLHSSDDGQTWSQLGGLDWPFAVPVVLDPDNPSTVFVGSPGTGFMVTGSPVVGANVADVLSADGAGFEWTGIAGAYAYDVARGLISEMRAQGDLSVAEELTCRGEASSVTDPGSPPQGDGFFYVARPRAGAMRGSWGSGPRDDAIAACP